MVPWWADSTVALKDASSVVVMVDSKVGRMDFSRVERSVVH